MSRGVAAVAAGLLFGAVACLLFSLYYAVSETLRVDPVSAAAAREYRSNNRDVVACRAAGGFPVFSSWDGRMLDCRPLPVRAGAGQ